MLKPLTIVAAVISPLAVAGILAVGADSHTSPAEPRITRSSPAATAGKQPAATTPRVVATEQIEPGVVRIAGRLGDDQVSGTGFVYDAAKGYIVTNSHVVEGVSAIKVTAGQTQMSARLVAVAPCDDLAVLQVSTLPGAIRALPLGDSATVKTSQHVRAFGFPASLDSTKMSVTEGTVSSAGVAGSPGGDLPNFPSTIQHQAPINPGNSGGPLVDDAGRVIGVNTLGSASTQGQAYAISSDHVKSVLPGLLAGRSKDDVGWSLAPAQDMSFEWRGEDAAAYRQKIADDGLGTSMYVTRVKAGSPAAQAGIQTGDVIRAVEGSSVQSVGDACDIVQSRGAGQTVSISAVNVDRDDNSQPFSALAPMTLKLR